MVSWLAIAISGLIVGLLVLGNYTDKIHVSGVLLQAENAGLRAELYVPAQAIKFVRRGDSIQVHCQSETRTGQVSEISSSVLSREEIAAQSKTTVPEPMYRVVLALPTADGKAPPEEGAVEAEIRHGRRPLLQWLFER